MTLRAREFWIWTTLLCTLASGCQPTQPFFFMEDGDLSHYIDVSTQIEYPDIDEPKLAEVEGAQAPLTLKNFDNYTFWDLTLEEAIKYTLHNSDVLRSIGGRVASTAPDTLTRSTVNTQGIQTTFDPALAETAYGASTGVAQSGTGVEAALAEFDANLNASMLWRKNDTPINTQSGGFFGSFFTPTLIQDTGTFQAEINKAAAEGTQFFVRNNTLYDQNNNPSRALFSDWLTNIEAGFAHPLLQGRGTQVNRIAGFQSFAQAAGGIVNPIDGVMIQRIRTDTELANFEGGVRDLLRDVESNYWELYFAYRNLQARRIGRDSALETWRRVNELAIVGNVGGEAGNLAQAESQYHAFEAEVQTALSNLFRAENALRYIMGLSATDGRLIRPSDEPTRAWVEFDFNSVHTEALVRRVELRSRKWQLKRRELELIAARNQLLPRLDFTGQYRWVGRGDDFIDSASGLQPNEAGSNALENLARGNNQEWQMGLQFTMPFGFRVAHAAIRHHQLLLARERKLLEDTELEISHQVSDALRDLHRDFEVSQVRFSGLVAASREVDAIRSMYENGAATLDRVLDAQRRRSDAEINFFRTLIDYNLSIARVHLRKGSMLDYNSVFLAEGPWPGKAYFDAMREARRRDASMYLDYGFTRPAVISRGPVAQGAGAAQAPIEGEIIYEGPLMQQPTPAEGGAGSNGSDLVPTEAPPAPNQVLPSPGSEAKAAPGTTLSQVFGASALPTVAPPVPQQQAAVDNSVEPVAFQPIVGPRPESAAQPVAPAVNWRQASNAP